MVYKLVWDECAGDFSYHWDEFEAEEDTGVWVCLACGYAVPSSEVELMLKSYAEGRMIRDKQDM